MSLYGIVSNLRFQDGLDILRNVNLEMDLSSARAGTRVYRLGRDQIALPNDRINIVDIEPSQIEFKFKSKP
jgi:hypothetical protein